MNSWFDRTWFRRTIGFLLTLEAIYTLGLTILLGLIAPSSAKFEGNEIHPITIAIGGGLGVTVAAVLVAAAVFLWQGNPHRDERWIPRAVLLLAAAFHVVLAIGAVLGIISVLTGRSDPSEPLMSIAGSTALFGAALFIASAAARTAQTYDRTTSH